MSLALNWLQGFKWGRDKERPEGLPVRSSYADSTRSRNVLLDNAPARLSGVDQALIWITLALLIWGLVMVLFASLPLVLAHFAALNAATQ
jgi:cell division protein FtsW